MTGDLLKFENSPKAEVSEEYGELQTEIKNRQDGAESIHAGLLLYTNHLLKKCDSTDNSKQKLYLMENLGSSMFRLGASLPPDSRYGKVIEQYGQVVERLNDLQLQFITNVKEGWLSGLQRSIDDFKECQSLQKKLERNRGDYESKSAKLSKVRKDNVALEDDVRAAQVRYEDTYEDVTRRMLEMKNGDQDGLVELYSFYEAQLAYHKSCTEQLERVRGLFEENLRAKRAPASEHLAGGAGALGSRRSAMTLKSSDGNGSVRTPVPFSSHAHTQSLSRTSSARAPLAHRRNGSAQVTDASEDKSFGDISPFEDSSQDTSRRPPQFGRVQSDTTSPLRKAVPTVAPRRHAPPPPAPARSASRVLRRAIYNFDADEVGELNLSKGDIIEVTEKLDEGWWNGKVVFSVSDSRADPQKAKSGLFPSNYTEECTEADIPSAAPSRTPAYRSQTYTR
ncbi:hypothetical protein IWW45_004931 [Coemansia sp. RSA 485]|nr:hypothetical protein IWW45_004931 [Coemansia sp. RSA 485]